MRTWQGDPSGEMLAAAPLIMSRRLSADPTYAPPLCGLALTSRRLGLSRTPPSSRAAISAASTIEHALNLGQRAVELDPNLPDAHMALANILKWLHRRSESIEEYDRAFELNPNLADYRFGLALIHWGRTEEGMEYLRRIIRLDPFHPPACQTFLGNAYYQAARYEEALESLRAAARRLPNFRPTYVWLAATAANSAMTRRHGKRRQLSCNAIQRSPFGIGSICIGSPSRRMRIALRKDCGRPHLPECEQCIVVSHKARPRTEPGDFRFGSKNKTALAVARCARAGTLG